MIKKSLLAIATVALMGMTASAQKFGVVSVNDVLMGMPEVTEVQNKITEASKQYEDEYAKLNEELQKKFAEYQQLDKDAATPQSIKERRLQEIQDLDKKAQQFAETAREDLQRQQMQLMQPVQDKLLQAIKAVSAENNFLMVFPSEVPAYISTEVIDITPMVKAHLGVK